ncbi:MAG: hypothetical protein AAF665_06365 [Pseudomonadota bacterium]
MMRFFVALALCASPLAAQDFSEGSEARPWDLWGEVPARFEAKVIDILCDLTGDCPNDCGAGKRQLGLVRTADDVLILPMKNSQPAFSGAAQELAPFCNQVIEVDGLLIEDEDFPISNVYLVQRIKARDADWIKANTWTKKWAAEHPEAAGKGPWFRRDLRIKEIIEREGYLGLGLAVDQKFAEDFF